jgi:murein DD-endopeptidase MepM/ murein hydrolase activator NlpD
MKRRHPGRTTLVLATVSALGCLATGATPAAAATPATAGTVVTGGTALNMRAGATSSSALVLPIPNGNRVGIACQALGQTVTGTVRTTRVWDRLTNGYYLSDAYIGRADARIPVCSAATVVQPVPAQPPAAEPPAVMGAWMLPVDAGLVSGYRTPARPTHDGVDLGAVRNTPIHAAADGTVIRVVCNVSTNDCDVDGSGSLRGCGWYAEIQHAAGLVTRYCHMVRRPSVTVGQVVAEGQIIGYVGTSGSSSGPHLHFEVHSSAPAIRANALDPIPFMRARGLLIR